MTLIERWAAKTEEYEAGFEQLFDCDERLAEYADAVDSLRHEARRVWAALQRERGDVEALYEAISEGRWAVGLDAETVARLRTLRDRLRKALR
jgi:hypothetical protein